MVKVGWARGRTRMGERFGWWIHNFYEKVNRFAQAHWHEIFAEDGQFLPEKEKFILLRI